MSKLISLASILPRLLSFGWEQYSSSSLVTYTSTTTASPHSCTHSLESYIALDWLFLRSHGWRQLLRLPSLSSLNDDGGGSGLRFVSPLHESERVFFVFLNFQQAREWLGGGGGGVERVDRLHESEWRDGSGQAGVCDKRNCEEKWVDGKNCGGIEGKEGLSGGVNVRRVVGDEEINRDVGSNNLQMGRKGGREVKGKEVKGRKVEEKERMPRGDNTKRVVRDDENSRDVGSAGIGVGRIGRGERGKAGVEGNSSVDDMGRVVGNKTGARDVEKLIFEETGDDLGMDGKMIDVKKTGKMDDKMDEKVMDASKIGKRKNCIVTEEVKVQDTLLPPPLATTRFSLRLAVMGASKSNNAGVAERNVEMVVKEDAKVPVLPPPSSHTLRASVAAAGTLKSTRTTTQADAKTSMTEETPPLGPPPPSKSTSRAARANSTSTFDDLEEEIIPQPRLNMKKRKIFEKFDVSPLAALVETSVSPLPKKAAKTAIILPPPKRRVTNNLLLVRYDSPPVGREKEINLLKAYITTGSLHPSRRPSLIVFGTPGVGKSRITQQVLESSVTGLCWVDAIDTFGNSKSLFGLWARAIPGFDKHVQANGGNERTVCQNSSELVQVVNDCIKPNRPEADPFVFVLDGADDDVFSDFDLSTWTDLALLSTRADRNILVVMLLRRPGVLFRNAIREAKSNMVYFEEYTSEQIGKIFADPPFLAFKKQPLTLKQLVAWKKCLQYALLVFYKTVPDVRDFEYALEKLWPMYLNEEGRLLDKHVLQMKLHLDRRLTSRNVLGYRELSEKLDAMSSPNPTTTTAMLQIDIERKLDLLDERDGLRWSALPFYPKILLIACFLASYNPVEFDSVIFGKTKQRRKKPKSTSAAAAAAGNMADASNLASAKLIQEPSAFDEQRASFIYANLLFEVRGGAGDAREEGVLELPRFFALLCAKALLTKVSPDGELTEIKYKCIANRAFVEAVAKREDIDLVKYLKASAL